jgi:hypothetical protein
MPGGKIKLLIKIWQFFVGYIYQKYSDSPSKKTHKIKRGPIITVSYTRSRGQPACHEDQKK